MLLTVSLGIHISNIKSISKSDKTHENTTKSRTTRVSSDGLKSEQICKECHQSFETDLDLILHINRSHKEIESFVCHECKQVFNSRDVFSSHLLEHQTKDIESDSKSKAKHTITGFLVLDNK